MKTQKHISNLRKLGLVVLGSLALANGSLKAEDPESLNAMINLESFAKAHEAVLKYTAPVTDMEVESAVESLNSLAESNEVTLKYDASRYADADARAEEIAPFVESLEMIADSFVAALKYQAPDEDATVKAFPALEQLDMIADASLSALKYQAPANAENEVYDATDGTENDMLAETK